MLYYTCHYKTKLITNITIIIIFKMNYSVYVHVVPFTGSLPPLTYITLAQRSSTSGEIKKNRVGGRGSLLNKLQLNYALRRLALFKDFQAFIINAPIAKSAYAYGHSTRSSVLLVVFWFYSILPQSREYNNPSITTTPLYRRIHQWFTAHFLNSVIPQI